MSKGAREFVGDWVRDNVHPTMCKPLADAAMAKQHASECWKAADKAGVKQRDIERQLGSLIVHMEHEMSRINGAVARRRGTLDHA